jgi:hypothetical protein
VIVVADASVLVGELLRKRGRELVNTVQGVRFARNRVHHQWADALQITSGRAYPRTYPKAYFEWRWRATLPPGKSDQFKEPSRTRKPSIRRASLPMGVSPSAA